MCIRDSKPRSSLRRRRGRAVSRSRRGPDPEERRTDGAAQPTAQPTPLLALAEGREEAALAGAPAGGSTRSVPALALTAVTTLVVTGATRAPDARALAAGTALDTPGLAHLVARCIALGGQFGLVG